MILPMHGTTAFVEPRAAAACTDCGTAAAGNFCSTCGADLCAGSLGLFGFARRSFPAVYLQLLSAPIRATVALAEDRSYRTHLSFLLTSIAVFCLLMLPTLFEASGAAAPGAHVSESMQNLMRVLSQAGAYIGTAITFLIAFGLFRYFAREPRTLPAYFKLYSLAFGFVMPIYAAYEFVARHILGVTGMSSLGTVVQWTPSARCLPARSLWCCGPTSSRSTSASGGCPLEGDRALRSVCHQLISIELLAHVWHRPRDREGAASARVRADLRGAAPLRRRWPRARIRPATGPVSHLHPRARSARPRTRRA